jgi:hypothetical protein
MRITVNGDIYDINRIEGTCQAEVWKNKRFHDYVSVVLDSRIHFTQTLKSMICRERAEQRNVYSGQSFTKVGN